MTVTVMMFVMFVEQVCVTFCDRLYSMETVIN